MWDFNSVCLYLIALFLGAFFANKYDKDKQQDKIKYLVLALLPHLLLLALRSESMGPDLVRYFIHVDNTPKFEGINSLIEIDTEPIYDILYIVSASNEDSHSAFIWLSAILQYFLLFLALREFHKKGVNTMLILMLFIGIVGLRSYSMIRNGAAIAALLGAFAQFLGNDKRSIYKYWGYTILALGCHNSSIISIPIYYLCKISEKDTLKVVIMKFTLVMTGIVFLVSIGKEYMNLFFLSFEDGKYDDYIIKVSDIGVGNIITRLPFIIITLVFLNSLKFKYGFSVYSYLLLLIFDLAISLLRYLSSNLERLTMVTGMVEAILLSMLYPVFREKYGIISCLLLICYAVIRLIIALYTWSIMGEYGLMPYQMR